jgi:hypothetical protein
MSPFTDRAALEALCSSGEPEGLQLEFKEKEDASHGNLSKPDKRAIAEAVSSFANSDGGVLIYGVRSDKRGDVDVATELRPIEDIDAFASAFRVVCAVNISPELSAVNLSVIYADKARRRGFLVCEIQRSNSRPHMSTAVGVHSYYRRSFTGSALMTPSEIRDQILAIREAALVPEITIGRGGSYHPGYEWISVEVPIAFALRNTGDRICKNPFLRVSASCPLRTNSAYHDPALREWKVNTPLGEFIHVGDAKAFFDLKFIARPVLNELCSQSQMTAARMLAGVKIYPGDSDVHSRTILDKQEINGITLGLTYGAENATAQTLELRYSRDDLARALLTSPEGTLREMALAQRGIWREDLVRQL